MATYDTDRAAQFFLDETCIEVAARNETLRRIVSAWIFDGKIAELAEAIDLPIHEVRAVLAKAEAAQGVSR